MSKKGFLLAEELVKIVIAAACLGFLVYFLTAAYMAKLHSQELKHAQTTLDEILVKINLGGGEVLGLTPADWYLVGFVGQDWPDSCINKNCLCICEKTFFSRNQAKKCSENGVCKTVENLKGFSKIEIQRKDLTNIKVSVTPQVEITKIK